MDLLEIAAYVTLALLLIQLLRMILADGDLALMWAEKFGKGPEILKGQVVWITGSSTGIGEYLAYELAKVGCRLVLSARNKDLLEEVKKKCRGMDGLQFYALQQMMNITTRIACSLLASEDILVLPLDLRDLSSHKAATDQVLKTFGKIDILINNAARSQRALAIDTELTVDQEMIHLNVVGQLSLTKCVLPHMVERGKGHIVVTSSLAGKAGVPFSATYCLTKFGVNGWFSSLGVELEPKNIGVTIVCPGPVVSNISKVAFGAKPEQENVGTYKKKMSTERCATLMAIAIANRMGEVWICQQPILLFSYMAVYMPDITKYLFSKIGIWLIREQRKEKH